MVTNISLYFLLPGIPQSFGAAPLTAEAIPLTLVVVLGAAAAWGHFAEPHASAE